jgi:aspartate kinase
MRAVIMKFGGTSVADGDALVRLTALVRDERDRGERMPVVVVSAMSGVTDRLLSLSAAAERGDDALVESTVAELRRRHADAATMAAPGQLTALATDIEPHFSELRAALHAMAILRDAPPRSIDAIAAGGELLSSRLVCAALEDAGLPAVWVDPRRLIVTDEHYSAAVPLIDETARSVAAELMPHLSAGKIPVTGGFVGATRAGVTTTLGRGGSDYSAALLGAAIDAAEIQVWTDVDGMLSADPRIVDAPRLVSHLSFAEASELAYFGAKVLHPSTILPAVTKNIPVRILNSQRPRSRGSLITAEGARISAPLRAIACKHPVTVVDITSTRMLMAHGFLRRVFEVFERYRTAVDVVTTSEVSVSVTVDDNRQLDVIVPALREFAEVQLEPNMAILCTVGDNLRRDPRIATRVIRALEGYLLRLVSQAASRRNLTVVLSRDDVASAMRRLHDEFFKDQVFAEVPVSIEETR